MSKTLIFVLFFSILFVNLRATETETDPLKADSNGETLQAEAKAQVKKPAEKRRELLRFPSFLLPPAKGRAQGSNYGKMPLRYSMLFERTIYIETFFFCLVILYGILHLPIWVTLYEKLKKPTIESKKTGPSKTEELQMNETSPKDVKTSQ